MVVVVFKPFVLVGTLQTRQSAFFYKVPLAPFKPVTSFPSTHPLFRSRILKSGFFGIATRATALGTDPFPLWPRKFGNG